MSQQIQGVLLVDKPADWTSFDVVNYVRKMVAAEQGTKPKNTKVGHTGTLDPAATGLLVLLVGKAYTRRASELSKLDKTYQVTMKLGETSTTGDREGEIKAVSSATPGLKAVQEALRGFQGQIMQTPPAYSAIKVNGQRAYKLARQGQEVTLEARQVTIHHIELTDYTYPSVQFTTRVSSGTYIRSLVEDIGSRLETGAYMSALRRVSVGDFQISDALPVGHLSRDTLPANLLTLH
jgi:tRNA pseudouridine55 synthase